MDYKKFDELSNSLAKAYQKLDDEAFYKAEGAASVESVEAAEERLGVKLPEQLKSFLLNYSKSAEFRAFLPDEFCDEFPEEFVEIFCACFLISLDEIERAEENRQSWIEGCFTNEEDEYDRVWYSKLGIMCVPNGDVIALDTKADPENPPVVYLSHDDGEGHGAILGKDFETYMINLVKVGACGNEDWQMIPFMPDMENGIDPDCENAIKYRNLIGYNL